MWDLQDVAVNVVGKYRYYMDSAGEHGRLPIIVDIILVRGLLCLLSDGTAEESPNMTRRNRMQHCSTLPALTAQGLNVSGSCHCTAVGFSSMGLRVKGAQP